MEIQQKSVVGIGLEHLGITLTAVLPLDLDTPETIARWPVSITNDVVRVFFPHEAHRAVFSVLSHSACFSLA